MIACTPSNEREVSVSNWEFPVIQMQKMMCNRGGCPGHTIHILNGGWEKDTEVISTPERLTIFLLWCWLYPWIIQQGTNTTLSTSDFYSCFYLSKCKWGCACNRECWKDWRRKQHWHRVCLIPQYCFISLSLGCQLRWLCPPYSTLKVIDAVFLWPGTGNMMSFIRNSVRFHDHFGLWILF